MTSTCIVCHKPIPSHRRTCIDCTRAVGIARVPAAEHRLKFILAEPASTVAGKNLYIGTCTCGNFSVGPSIHSYLLGAYENHLPDTAGQP